LDWVTCAPCSIRNDTPWQAHVNRWTEREQVVAAYRAALGRSVDGYFSVIPDPADHPTLRIEPLAPADADAITSVSRAAPEHPPER